RALKVFGSYRSGAVATAASASALLLLPRETTPDGARSPMHAGGKGPADTSLERAGALGSAVARQTEVEDHRGAGMFLALDRERGAHGLGEADADREADAGALVPAGEGAFRPHERVAQLSERVVRDAAAPVRHGDPQPSRLGRGTACDLHPAPHGREFYRVADH